MPDARFEAEAHSAGYKVICGIDEAGRGPWAGPVTAAAVILDLQAVPKNVLAGLDDSKKLKAAKRDALFEQLTATIDYGVGTASVEEIDQLNILQATFLAMRRAVGNLSCKPDFALIDGNKCPGLDCEEQAVVKGDSLSYSIAAASIIAKVSRDRSMQDLASRFPGYGWERNAGYGTREHSDALLRLGVTEAHRKSYAPIRKILGR